MGRTHFYKDAQNGRHLYYTIDRDIDKYSAIPSHMLIRELSPDKFNMVHSLKTKYTKIVGSGGYGIVYAGIRVGKYTNLPIAKKSLFSEKNYIRELNNSIKISNKMKSMTVNQTYDELNAIANDYRICAIYDIHKTDDKMTIRMQYAGGGTLKDFIKSVKRMKHLPSDYILLEKIIAYNIICGIFALHRIFKFAHLDIKPENIVFIENPLEETDAIKRCLKAANLRIIDFGMAEELNDDKKQISCRGTLETMAPELTAEKIVPLNPKYDTWSIGCIIWNLITLEKLLLINYMEEASYQHYMIRKYPEKFIKSLLKNIHDEDLKTLIKSALNPSINMRPNVGSLLNYKWFDNIPFETVPNFVYGLEKVRRLDLNIEETHKYLENHVRKSSNEIDDKNIVDDGIVMEERLSPMSSPMIGRYNKVVVDNVY